MHCARCGSFAEETADFCTECGAQLRLVGDDDEPIHVGTWSTAASDAGQDPETVEDVTVPIAGTLEQPSATGAEPDPSTQPEAPAPEKQPARGLITEMGEREKAAWLDDVWGLPDDRGAFGRVGF